MNDLLSIRGLTKNYGDFVLSPMNLVVPSGTVVGLVGSNGAGKTTIIKSVLGLVRPDGGTIDLLGCSVADASSRALVAAKQHIGVVFDTCAFPRGYSIETVRTTMAAVYKGWDNQVFDHYLGRFGLPSNKRVEKLSRGMSMKLSLACALSHDARLLILDEATAGLDPMAREEVLGILRDYMEVDGRAILMATHITTDLERMADYLVCIDGGREVFSLEKDAITEGAGIARCRVAEFEALASSGLYASGELRYLRGDYGVNVLVPRRADCVRAFPSMVVDRASIEEYMTFTIKGEQR